MWDEASYLRRANAFVTHEVVRPGLIKAHVIRLLRDERPCDVGHEVWRLQHRPCPSCGAQA